MSNTIMKIGLGEYEDEYGWVSVADDMGTYYVTMPDARPYLIIHGLRVRYEHQGQGHGRRLMEAAVATAHERGMDAVLEVWSFNTPAVTLYESLGFQVVGRRPCADPSFTDEVLLMRKQVTTWSADTCQWKGMSQ